MFCFSTKKEMLKPKYRYLMEDEIIEKAHKNRVILDDEQKVLKSFRYHLNNVTSSPSDQDKATLAKAYHQGTMSHL